MKKRFVKLHIKKLHSLKKYVCDYVEYIDEKYISLNNVYMYGLNKDGFFSYNDQELNCVVVFFDLKNENIKEEPSYIAFIKYKQVLRMKKIKRLS